MPDSMKDLLTTYLVDAHSIEEQALQQLRKAPDIAGEPGLEEALRVHLEETETQEQRVRDLLEARGASPSKVKDLVMRAGGSGFLLFARSQVDTPGKLASHAYSYEAMEWASYELLAKTADRAGEPDVARVARGIQAEERQMMKRIEGLFDQTTAASLDAGSDDIQKRLQRYLADAHAIEAQSIQLLHSGADMMDSPTWNVLFEEHEAESRRQQEVLEQRIEEAGGTQSTLKDAAMRFGALQWGMFFGAQPDTPAKLAVFAYAFEHLEIGGYEQLKRVAERAADSETVRAVEQILSEERRAAERFVGAMDEALTSAFESAGDRPRSRQRDSKDDRPQDQYGGTARN